MTVGAAVGTAVSFTGYYDGLLTNHRGVFRILEDVTSPFATLATMVRGKASLVRVDGPVPADLPAPGYGTFDESGAGTWLGAGQVTVTVLAPSGDHLALVAAAAPGPGAPPHAHLALRVQSPGQEAIQVPVASGSVRLPIRLHWGLNRITVNLIGPRPSSPQELYLSHIVLGR